MTFTVLAVAVGAYALLQSLVIPVLPVIQTAVRTDQSSVAWVLTAFLLSAAIFTPIIGRLGDIWGKDRVLVAAIFALAAGCVISALADSISVMVLGRVVQGVGGGVVPLSFGIIRDEFPKHKVAGGIGAIGSLTAAGSGVGVVLAGPLVSATSYRWLFLLPAVILFAAGSAAYVIVPASPVRTGGQVSWTAAVLLSGALVALLLPISEAPSWGWTSPAVGILLLAAVGLAFAWVAVEKRVKQPLVDMGMMRIPVVSTTNLVALLFGMGMYAVFAFVPELLQTPAATGYGFGATVTESGFVMLPMSIFMLVAGTASGQLIGRYGGKSVLLSAALASGCAFALVAIGRNQLWEIVTCTAVLGLSFGLAFAAMSSLVVQGVPTEQTGVASGMNANIRLIGGSIGAALASSIIAGSATEGRFPDGAGYAHAFVVMLGATIAAGVAALRLPASAPAVHSSPRSGERFEKSGVRRDATEDRAAI